MENAEKLKIVAKEKEKKAVDTAWKSYLYMINTPFEA